LRFIVEQALLGNQLKETLLGVEVFGRIPSYDPRLDGVVRVEAVKLRSRLKEYYETEGAADPIRIDLPKGGYLPSFATVPCQAGRNRASAAAPRLVDGLARLRPRWRWPCWPPVTYWRTGRIPGQLRIRPPSPCCLS
jgi:hypothetical protein